MGRRTLAPDDTAQFDLNQLRDSQIPDVSGNKLPQTLAKAKFTWSLVGEHEGRHLIGRNQVIDAATRRASSFSCGDCPTYDAYPIIENDEPYPFYVGQTGSLYAYEAWNDQYGNAGQYPVDAYYSVTPSGVESINDQIGWSSVSALNGGRATVGYVYQWSQSQWDGLECIWDSGESDESFQDVVNDPTPNISQVVPTIWNSGMTTQVTVSGTGFGTSPTLNITDPAGAIIGISVTSASDEQIIANVTVADTTSENASVSVNSNGYNGSGFVSNQGNSRTSNTVTTSILGPAGFGVTILGPTVLTSAGEASSVVAGQTTAIRVDVLTPSGLVDSNYVGTVHFSSTDSSASLPGDYTYSLSDGGSHTFSIVLKTVNGQSATRDFTVADQSARISLTTNFYVWFATTMDVELWKNCNFVSCSSTGALGSYYCGTAYKPSSYYQSGKTSFIAITQSSTSLANKPVYVFTSAGNNRSNRISTVIQDAGPVLGDAYWNGAAYPSVGGCISDGAADALSVTYGCNGAVAYGNATVYWRFQ